MSILSDPSHSRADGEEAVFSLTKQCGRFEDLIAGTAFTNFKSETISSEEGTLSALGLLAAVKRSNGCIYIVGNGGSAAVAAHAVTDFVNAAGLRAITLHESSLLTCLANDYGYEAAFARALQCHFGKEDLLIAISSSGKSKNILNAAEVARQAGGRLITLTGFDRDNPLRQRGDLNIWLDSREYGPVEIGHLFILHYFSDRIVHDKKKSTPSK